MIEEKELRLGNLYAAQTTDEIVVKGINTEKNSVIAGFSANGEKRESILFKDLRPIALTESNVLRLGFKFLEEFGGKKYFQIDNQAAYGVLFDDGVLCFYYYHQREGYTILLCDDPYFKYVHHIQNLYFALTGQELPIE